MVDRPGSGADLAHWLAYLQTLHPKAIDLGLDRARVVANTLSLLKDTPPTLTVAGTNGKGSCVAVADALARASGLSVGSYTSPHLVHFHERFSINGSYCNDCDIVAAFEAIDDARDDVSLSYFEFATLAALWLFKREGVALQILEVGLGGRLDAVNLVDASVCVITSIGLDHTDWLGDTRELIAIEKAGVARAGAAAIVADLDPPETLMPELERLGAEPLLLGRDWQCRVSMDQIDLVLPSGKPLSLPRVMGLQPENLGAAVVALDQGGWLGDNTDTPGTLGKLRLPGRQQRLQFRSREIFLDVAHNTESVLSLAGYVAANPTEGHVFAVFGAMGDKPLRAMLAPMSDCVDSWYLAGSPGEPRAAGAKLLRTFLPATAGESQCFADSGTAFHSALSDSLPGDRLIVFGSFVVVGQVMEQLLDDGVMVGSAR